MDNRFVTSWDLYLALVTDIDGVVNQSQPAEIEGNKKYLTVNEKIIYPCKDLGFRLQEADHESRLTLNDYTIDLSTHEPGSIYPVSAIYSFKSFRGSELLGFTTPNVFSGGLGRIIDISSEDWSNMVAKAKEDFSSKLKTFDLDLNHQNTYLRFFMY